MPDFLIRPGTPSDLSFLGAIEAAGDAQFPSGRFPGPPGSDNVPIHELEEGLEAGLLLVADWSGELVGFQFAEVIGQQLHLRLIVVLPQQQGRGVGRAFLEELFQQAVTMGLREITLTTFEDIAWNAPLYQHFGFRVMQERELTSALKQELDNERAAGMTHRVAMCRRTAP